MRARSNLTREQASQRFYAEVWPKAAVVVRFARVLTHNAAEADDLAQDTMLKAYESIENLRPGSNVQAWLLTILRNSWIDRFRAKKSRPTVSLEVSEVPNDSTVISGDGDMWAEPEELLNRFGDEEIIKALNDLPDEIRWTLLLVDVQGLPHDEAADVLNVPPGTIKSRAHRGRAMLRQTLEPRARELGFIERVPHQADGKSEVTS